MSVLELANETLLSIVLLVVEATGLTEITKLRLICRKINP